MNKQHITREQKVASCIASCRNGEEIDFWGIERQTRVNALFAQRLCQEWEKEGYVKINNNWVAPTDKMKHYHKEFLKSIY